MAANLSFTKLYQNACALTETLRPLSEPTDKDIEICDKICRQYNLIVESISVLDS